MINWRMPKCNSLLQTEKDLFNAKFDQICPNFAIFRPFFDSKTLKNFWAFPS